MIEKPRDRCESIYTFPENAIAIPPLGTVALILLWPQRQAQIGWPRPPASLGVTTVVVFFAKSFAGSQDLVFAVRNVVVPLS